MDDRRDACRGLKALSKKYRVEVGAQGMTALIHVLENDFADCEILSYALDTLCNITSPEPFEEELENPMVSVNIGEQFTEMFMKRNQNVTVLLNLLAEYDFRVRWSTVKLLTGLVANKTKEVQEIVLVSPMAVSKLMDLLSDTRDVIRNDALLLLTQLTKSNANIQKIVAFENAFDRLFDVIRDEGCSDGGIVVEDCLILMLNLIKNNTSNQQFFKEGSYIQRLAPMFELPPEIEEVGMSAQKVSNLHFMLQIVRALVNPSNSAQVIQSCQKTMRGCGLLETLCKILMGSGIPSDILTETINTVAEVIRGNQENQNFFDKVMAPSSPPRPSIVVLLMSMVNDKQPLVLRCAVLYCYESYLYKNNSLQSALIETLLPSTTAVSSLTAGQLLCGGLFSNDSVSNWFSAVSLMHGLINNVIQKEQLLRVLLATSPGGNPVSLLTQCTILLQQPSYKSQSKIGILMFLSEWLNNAPMVVKSFLSTDGTIAFLIAQICSNDHDENEYLIQGLCAFLLGICIQFNDNLVLNYRKEDLCQLLIKRIGVETYSTKLAEVSRHESYPQASKQPQLRVRSATDLFLDYEFCRLFKFLESTIIKTVHGFDRGGISMTELTLSSEASGIVSQYKDVIREQDQRLQQLQASINQIQRDKSDLEQKLSEALTQNSRLTDQNTLLKAQLSTSSTSATMSEPITVTASENHHVNNVNIRENDNSEKIEKLEEENAQLRRRVEDLEKKNEEKGLELEKFKKDQEDLLELLADQVSFLNI